MEGVMTSLLRESIEEIRQYKAICESSSDKHVKSYSEKIIVREWKNVQLYRSDKPMPVLLVKGLYDQDVYFRGHEDFCEALESLYFEEGMKITIEVVMMTGCQFGRLPVLDL
jgi:hypothetical protein